MQAFHLLVSSSYQSHKEINTEIFTAIGILMDSKNGSKKFNKNTMQ